MKSLLYTVTGSLLLTLWSLTAFSQSSSQDTSEIEIVLRGCLKDVYRLDSSLAQHEVKDSLILTLYELNEHWRYKSYLQEGMLSNKDTIISRQYDVEDTYKEELKVEKKRTRKWQMVSGGLGVLIILILI